MSIFLLSMALIFFLFIRIFIGTGPGNTSCHVNISPVKRFWYAFDDLSPEIRNILDPSRLPTMSDPPMTTLEVLPIESYEQ